MGNIERSKKRTHRYHKKAGRMEHPENLLSFQFGKLKAIGIKSFKGVLKPGDYQRRTNIFKQIRVPDESVLIQCFKLLETDKYNEIINTTELNEKLGKQTVWVVGFQSDELTPKRDDFFFFYLLFTIQTSDKTINEITLGEKYLLCINVVYDVSRHVQTLPDNQVEETLCYYRDETDNWKWKKEIRRHISTGLPRY